jgi:hypothetical protein
MTGIYELTVRGPLGEALTSEFAAADLVVVTKPVESVIVGCVEDTAALYGLIRRIEALGLDLVEVRRAHAPGAAPAVDAPTPRA